MRIPFGLDHLPRAMRYDDPRLPGVTLGAEALRLNTEAVPAEVMTIASDHAGRVVAMNDFLRSLCGNYAVQRQRFVENYIVGASAHIEAHRRELATRLKRYHGLYAAEDWLWSALRPLPRAWLPAGEKMVLADIAFWDGTRFIVIDFSDQPEIPGVTTCRIDPAREGDDPITLLKRLPRCFQFFWNPERLPVSPFRRPIPAGAVPAH